MKKKYLIAIPILGVLLISMVFFIQQGILANVNLTNQNSVGNSIPMNPITTVYTEYNGTYFPYKLVVTYYPGNASTDSLGFPSEWTVSNFNQDHEAVVNTTNPYIIQGLNYEIPVLDYVGGNAIPLSTPPSQLPWAQQMGVKGALVMETQMAGEALGVTLADNLLFVETDSLPGGIIALNPVTGNVVWMATGLAGQAMNNPIVYNGIVYVSVGGVCFTFSEFVHYEEGQYQDIVRARNGALYAFNATNGELIWMRFTMGEAMPAPAIYDGILAYTTGGGCFVGLNATTGQVLWMDRFPGLMGNMASVNYYILPNGTPLFIAGFTYTAPPYGYLIAVNGITGQEAWNATMPKPYIGANTGLGDVSPAVDQKADLVIDNDIANFSNGEVDMVTFALNATNGKPVWATNLGRGPIPPAYKGGMPLIVGNVIYDGNPSLGTVNAISLTNGSILWETKLPDLQTPPSYPGGPRGSPTYYHGLLWVSAGTYIYVINPHSGQLLTMYNVGGRFGIVNPVIAGGTMFLSNSYGWLIAIPLSQIYPAYIYY
ncbi:PQQ-binding-like beta-propeller repeat protein [Acidianus sulfidivorans JP7]|uniref:Pyrrolo-quinoline quinone n=1 Tax=Acidianus sulfidivorans JP7 TaxID=619593 RepID=A0A2U9IL93_9CREN|nr:PQQ-binding-like beta-propeller repeat protein [Acidianus sulfidivorans]AWR96765.1 PQQ-binding-like beta-propeller repeat protein [Acidianus sulfidivorans JP7]